MGKASKAKAMRRAAEQQQDVTRRYGFYLVAYIDILGQRQELRKLTKLPHTPEGFEEAKAILRRTAGRVMKVRRVFQNVFDRAKQRQNPPSPLLTPEQAQWIAEMRQLTFYLNGFSDSVVVAVPLGDPQFGVARGAGAVWIALYGIAGLSLAALADGFSLRIGIDVERAVNITQNEVYGPVLEKAYHLECEVAQYPRAVIGNTLISYLARLKELPGHTPEERYAKLNAIDCDSLITRDPDDGLAMLHILSRSIFEDDAPTADLDIREPAYQWVKTQVDVFANDSKLLPRYQRLLKYFETHAELPAKEQI